MKVLNRLQNPALQKKVHNLFSSITNAIIIIIITVFSAQKKER